MPSRLLSWFPVAIAAALVGIAGAIAAERVMPEETPVERLLRASHEEWGNEWSRREADRIMARYAPDAVLFVPGAVPALGPEASAPFIRGMLSNPAFSLAWAVDRVRVSESGDVAYLYGRYVQHNPTGVGTGHTIETGHYMTALEKRQGRWLAVADIHTPGPLASRAGLPEALFTPPSATR